VSISVDRRARYELAHFGEAIGDPSRAAMLIALMGGVARPASELAREARVAPSTATTHLRGLVDAGLVVVRAQGRHRYYALAGTHVADALEHVVTFDARAAPSRRAPARPPVDDALARARTCYCHLAGKLAVAFWERCVEQRWVQWGDAEVTLTARGHDAFARGGLVVDASLAGRSCLDWSERVPHVSGRLGVAVCDAMLERRWLKLIAHARELSVTPRGADRLAALGVRWR